MFHFLRKIRRSLINSGHMRKYTLYAIGEIALVVIGILIALSINNWNEANKIIVLESKYIARIKLDLIQDTIYFNRRLEESEKVIDDNYKLIHQMYEEQRDKKDYSELLSLTNWNSEHLTVQNSTFTELLSSGQLDIFSNHNLKMNIISLYKDMKKFLFMLRKKMSLAFNNIQKL